MSTANEIVVRVDGAGEAREFIQDHVETFRSGWAAARTAYVVLALLTGIAVPRSVSDGYYWIAALDLACTISWVLFAFGAHRRVRASVWEPVR